VVFIMGLLLAGVMTPLSTQVQLRRAAETQKTMEEIKEALNGFAVINGRLPRPAQSAVNGSELATPCATDLACTGFIPWQTLGVAKSDAWGKMIRYSVSPNFADAPFTLSTIGTKSVQTRDASGALVTQASNVPAVILSYGKNNWGASDTGLALSDNSGTNADEDTNNAATVTFINRNATDSTTAPGGEFDDLVLWLSPNVLMSRMVSAQRLP
jgi:type II secretory pathway pseudopilin PulG